MKSFVLIYESFAQFEVVLANYFLATKSEIVTVGFHDGAVTSAEGFQTLPHVTLEQIDLDEVDCFIIPGGDPEKADSPLLLNLLKDLNRNNIPVAGICGGTLQLAKAGLLDHRKFTSTLPLEEYHEFPKENFQDRNVVVDGGVVTAKANGYVDFAIELAGVMDIYEDDADRQETIRFFKEFKDN